MSKKCRACKKPFSPGNSLQVACSAPCALAYAKQQAEKKAATEAKATRQWLRKQKEALKSRGDHLKEAQAAFNAFIRERDHWRPCISCGAYPDDRGLMTGSRIDAGHYRSVGACPELRFEPLNCHAQCVKCNQHLSGNTVEYRIRLLERIGPEAVAWLEGPHDPKKYSIDDIKAIKAEYRAKTRNLQKQRAAA